METNARARSRGQRLSGTQRVWIGNAVLVTLGAYAYDMLVRPLPANAGPVHIPWWALAVGFFLAEIFVVHVHYRRDAHSVSLSELPLVLGLFFASPGELLGAQILGAGLALIVHRRQSIIKLCFNLSHFVLGSCLALAIFHAVGHPDGHITPADWGGAFAAAFAAATIAVVSIFCAISLSQGSGELRQFAQTYVFSMIVTVTNTSIAVIAAVIVMSKAYVAIVLVVPAMFLLVGYRSYVRQRDKGESLEFLYQSIRALHQSPGMESAMLAVLTEARKTFRAELAEILIVRGNNAERGLRTVVLPNGETEVTSPTAPCSTDGPQARALASGQSILLPRPANDEALEQCFGTEIFDAMVVPLRGENRVLGTMLVANRLGEVSSFDEEDLKLFETLADHVGVSLENTWLERSLAHVTALKEELKRQALHDALTQLANRTLFTERVERALIQRRRSQIVTVLFLDLDDFKTVNDSLGHAAGDMLLVEVADRLRSCFRPTDTAARLGGDEFAVLVEDDDPQGAMIVAERIIAAMRAPFELNGKDVFVHTSIGIAMALPGQCGADELLRNADVAMYMAKKRGKGGYEIFDERMYLAALERLELTADLQRAVKRGEFELEYQPIVDLTMNRIIGVEALVRWNHPTRGLMQPLEFIPLAEETGLIIPLGRWVLERACRDVAAWQKAYPFAGPPLTLSVNASVRQVQHPAFVAEIKSTLSGSGLRPQSLIIEITESVLMDPASTFGALEELQRIGVRLAIDDFGTGYSSLSYLKQCPIDILKIDKAFVRDVGSAIHAEDGLARAIIELSRTLGLTNVAEGIETQAQLQQLRALGCTMGQGFHLLGPVRAGAMDALIRAQETPVPRAPVVASRAPVAAPSAPDAPVVAARAV